MLITELEYKIITFIIEMDANVCTLYKHDLVDQVIHEKK